MMSSCNNRRSEEGSGLQGSSWSPLDGSEPAEIEIEVARRNAVEMVKPTLESAVVSIDVLDVPRAVDADAGREIDGVMLDLQGFRWGDQRTTAVGVENGIRVATTWGASSASRMKSVVAPEWSRVISTGTCSFESSRFLALRANPLRCPLDEGMKKVSSVSATPLNT